MSASAPTSTPAWVVTGTKSDSFDGIELQQNIVVPQVSENGVLVQLEAVSLNFRDLAIPRGLYPFPMKTPVIAGSDAAGTVIAVGVGVGPVEHDVVGAQEVALGHDLEADSEDVPSIDGVGVRVVDFKGSYGRGYAICALLHVGRLLG
ncbi:hypothetical protein NQ176_g8906 [Zarea fungicola]|uniref:Uncharacterized protein n=1 Tax=Zarea fungicola TaxID=93591 RepID=A0ACC1MQJ7_9HYPO|nr:hypothetical protein NQ176_g8906 [Lecanicillium fungicola]